MGSFKILWKISFKKVPNGDEIFVRSIELNLEYAKTIRRIEIG